MPSAVDFPPSWPEQTSAHHLVVVLHLLNLHGREAGEYWSPTFVVVLIVIAKSVSFLSSLSSNMKVTQLFLVFLVFLRSTQLNRFGFSVLS